MVTLKDVGARAGVSISTVSLVLNGRDAGRVKPAISDRVRAAAEELQYLPNLVARSLRSSQTHTIGVLSDEVASTPYAGQMISGAQRAAWARGYLLMLIDTGGDPELEPVAMKSLNQRSMDGLIYASMYHRRVRLPAWPAGTPLVLLDGKPARDEPVDWVVPDERQGAEDAVALLIAAGHRRIGFLNSDQNVPAVAEREAGYVAAMRRSGTPVDDSFTVSLDATSPSEIRRAAAALLSRSDRPTAVFCYADHVAAGVYQVAASLGIDVPTDLSVVGFDNDVRMIEALTPGLTTIQLPHEAMGEWAIERVLRRIDDPSGVGDHIGRLMPCPVIERRSIAAPR